jgi:arylsulfatase A-like enzyme
VIPEQSTGLPGYNSIIGRDHATIGRILRDNGYATSGFGKNHNTPAFATSQAGPFEAPQADAEARPAAAVARGREEAGGRVPAEGRARLTRRAQERLPGSSHARSSKRGTHCAYLRRVQVATRLRRAHRRVSCEELLAMDPEPENRIAYWIDGYAESKREAPIGAVASDESGQPIGALSRTARSSRSTS